MRLIEGSIPFWLQDLRGCVQERLLGSCWGLDRPVLVLISHCLPHVPQLIHCQLSDYILLSWEIKYFTYSNANRPLLAEKPEQVICMIWYSRRRNTPGHFGIVSKDPDSSVREVCSQEISWPLYSALGMCPCFERVIFATRGIETMNKYKAAQYMSASMVACSHAPMRLGVIFKLSASNANGFEGN
jgi:hypothetical protein